ncbi:MAG: nicotinate (nicotinamide) nucleotide adenylyltransferase [Anaerolineales bacterium]|nr:nicotinate (nicotinamide) nucleotide adenylyltransferase [Anaerolineales bacterium]
MPATRLGLLGGTFDPPHNGHLLLARAARAQLNLDFVLWVVTADPPHKQERQITPVADRLDLVAAAIAGEPAFAISRVDVDRPGPHWAADTVALLQAEFPNAELFYLMGGDSLRDLPTWGRPREFVAGCTLGVLRRPGDEVDLASLEQKIPGVTERLEFVDVPPLNIASHEVRQRVRAGRPIDQLVPPAVARLIQDRGLYC